MGTMVNRCVCPYLNSLSVQAWFRETRWGGTVRINLPDGKVLKE